MSTIITQFGQHAHPDPHRGPAAARRRQDRLVGATVEDMESALAFLSMIDPEAFEIAFTAAAPRVSGDSPLPADEEPMPVCRACGAPVGIFLDHGLRWQHFRGEEGTSGTQEVYDPGHRAQVGWLLPGEDPGEL
jgi:hypothetical protein